MVRINRDLEIPDHEIRYRYARSSGPGGQNVNKVATKVTLLFDVRSSPSLTEDQRVEIEHELAKRISKDGILRVTSERHRTRGANQRATVKRFVQLISEALEERPQRRPTKVPQHEKRRRREEKRRRSRLKGTRARPTVDE